MAIVKIGSVELTQEEALRYYSEGKYIVTYGCLYQLFYSVEQKTVYGLEIYRQAGMTRRGRFFAMDAKAVNHLVGFNLLNEYGDESMAQIIEFPRREQTASNTYRKLTRLIDAADSEATLELYMEGLVVSHEEGLLYPGEAEKLSAQIRSKSRDLAKPEKKMVMVQEVIGPGLYIWCPEMGEGQPECQIRARIGHYGTHYYLDSPLDLKGRGITFLEKHEAKNLTASGQFMAGWNRYKATERAFQKLQEQYSISMESNFD